MPIADRLAMSISATRFEILQDSGVGPTLRFTEAEFAAWLDGGKKGEFDHLIRPRQG